MNRGFSGRRWHAWLRVAGQLWPPTAIGACVPTLCPTWPAGTDVLCNVLLIQDLFGICRGFAVSVVLCGTLSEYSLNLDVLW